jgi:D-alanyl-lipoteichoic acid acyltransferase DltB (MBOAT superfamily)
MNVHTLSFMGFTAIVLVFYYLIPRRYQNVLLLLASYMFYVTFAWWFAVVLCVLTAITFFAGRGIAARNHPGAWLGIGLTANLSALAVFKVAGFLQVETVEFISRFGLPTQADGLRILLPIGLSFYVLQGIAYVVESYRGQLSPPGSLVDFALYMAYFPKLTAGPIERPAPFLKALRTSRLVDNKLISNGFCLIGIGLVRKVVVADTLILAIPQGVFQNPARFSTWELVYWLMVYAFGLYNDFCGYTNIARGVSALFGIELTRNFNNPFMFKNITDLWTRWHISLSSWLRDYIYYPLSRVMVRRNPSLENPLNIILPVMVTMVASGIWHGSQLNFLAWGALMGIVMSAERLVAVRRPSTPATTKFSLFKVGAFVYFRLVVLCGLVVFLLDLPATVRYFSALVTNTDGIFPDMRIALVLIPGLFIDTAQARSRNETVFLTWPLASRALLFALAMATVFVFAQSRPGRAFIYQGF